MLRSRPYTTYRCNLNAIREVNQGKPLANELRKHPHVFKYSSVVTAHDNEGRDTDIRTMSRRA